MCELPSQVVDRRYLRAPPVKSVVDSDEEWSRCGKWILNDFSGDRSWTDKAWVDLQRLVEEGSLLMIKTTTAALAPTEQHILCYTKPGKETIKRAAIAIRRVVEYDSLMHYKINSSTEEKIDHRYGHKAVAVYMHSYLGRFYTRDNMDLWRLDEDIKNDETAFDDLSQLGYHDFQISDNELPSTSRKHILIDGPSSLQLLYAGRNIKNQEFREYITTECSLKKEDQGCLTEADRLWLAGRILIEEGTLKGMVCTKKRGIAELKFYVHYFLSADLLAGICDTIFKTSNVKGFMYFRTFKEGWTDKVLYKLSSEGELYRNYKFISAISR